MNEYVETSHTYKDRSTGLIIFGIMTIGLGCLTWGLVALMLIGQAVTVASGKAEANFSAILPAIFIYLVLGIALIWLGIGSIMAKRWARALLLIFSWSWLAMGTVVVVAMIFLLPIILAQTPTTAPEGQPIPSRAIMGVVLIVTLLVEGFIFIVLPAIWVYFYNSPHVKATCEARDPNRSWTEACPLPVLAAALWALFSGTILLGMPFSNHGVMPFFGIFLTGIPGTLLCLLLAVGWLSSAWLLYRLNPQGWWLATGVMGVFLVSAVLTYAQHDVAEMYRLMHYPEAQIEQIQKMGLFTGSRMAWMTFFCSVPFLGYLGFIKRYFNRVG